MKVYIEIWFRLHGFNLFVRMFEFCFYVSTFEKWSCWSALATTPASISARAGAKEAINFIETCLAFFCFFVSPTIKLPLLSNIGSWNSVCSLISTQLKEIWRKKLGLPTPPLSSLNRVKTNNSTSKQHRKLKFGVQSYFNLNKERKKKWSSPG